MGFDCCLHRCRRRYAFFRSSYPRRRVSSECNSQPNANTTHCRSPLRHPCEGMYPEKETPYTQTAERAKTAPAFRRMAPATEVKGCCSQWCPPHWTPAFAGVTGRIGFYRWAYAIAFTDVDGSVVSFDRHTREGGYPVNATPSQTPTQHTAGRPYVIPSKAGIQRRSPLTRRLLNERILH